MKHCKVHNSAWHEGKWAREYFLIWCRDVAGLEQCVKDGE